MTQSKALQNRLMITIFCILLSIGGLLYLRSQRNGMTGREWEEFQDTASLITNICYGLAAVGVVFLVLSVLYIRKWRATEAELRQQKRLILSIAVPRSSNKKVQTEAAGFWRRLGDYLPRGSELPTEHMTMEVLATREREVFAISVPADSYTLNETAIRGEITQQYPDAQMRVMVEDIKNVPKVERRSTFADPLGLKSFDNPENVHVRWIELGLSRPDVFPLGGGDSSDKDPIHAILGPLSAIDSTAVMSVQYMVRSAPPKKMSEWQGILQKINVNKTRGRKASGVGSKQTDAKMKVIEGRLNNAAHVFEVGIRVVVAAESEKEADKNVDRLMRAISAQNKGKWNSLRIIRKGKDADTPIQRAFPPKKPIFLTNEELGNMMHLPPSKDSEQYNKLVRGGARRLAPDSSTVVLDRDDPTKRTYGSYTYESTGEQVQVGHDFIWTRQHVFVGGATGSGKSTVLVNLVLEDFLKNGAGGLVLDPHVDFINDIMECIPPEKMKDIIIMDIRDDKQPFTYNLCAGVRGLRVGTSVENVVGSIRVASTGATMGIQIESILTNAFSLAIGVLGSNASITTVLKILNDEIYREELLARCNDLEIANTVTFWTKDFAKWPASKQADALSSVYRRLYKITGNPSTRRAMGMSYSTVNLSDALNDGKLILVPLHNSMGEGVKRIFGALMVRDFYSTMLQRADIPKKDRRQAMLVMDEMANFVGGLGGFVEKLAAECRKYGAALIGATQFYGQMPDAVLAEVKENFRTQIVHQGGPDYAAAGAKILGLPVEPDDIKSLPPYTSYMKMVSNGSVTKPAMVQMNPPREPSYTYDELPKPPGRPKLSSRWDTVESKEKPPKPLNMDKATPLQIFEYVEHMSKNGKDGEREAVDVMASLRTDKFEAVLSLSREYDNERRDYLLKYPGMIKDPVKRLTVLSRWGYGIRSYMLDGAFMRDNQSSVLDDTTDEDGWGDSDGESW